MANNITIEHAQIIFRNFAGEEQPPYNPAGRRNFSVILEEDAAMALKADGWNIKPLRRRDEDEAQRYHLPVAVNFGAYPPKVVAIQGKKKRDLTDETVAMLDYADIINVDLIIRPRQYEAMGRSGVKAYLKCGYFTIDENELDKKYADYAVDGEEMPF